MSRIDESMEFVPVRIAVLTVSDSRSLDEDKSGKVLVDRISEAGHILADRKIVQDERALISDQLRAWVPVYHQACQKASRMHQAS